LPLSSSPLRSSPGNIYEKDLLYSYRAYYDDSIFKIIISKGKLMGQCVSHTRGPVEKQKQDELSETYTIDDFKFVKLIGKGGFSKVWKVEEKKTGRVFALKVMDKAKIITKKSVKAVLTERKILSRLNDSGAKFIVTIRGSFQDKANLYLLMDYM
jgi:serine/threonine protein kinase